MINFLERVLTWSFFVFRYWLLLSASVWIGTENNEIENPIRMHITSSYFIKRRLTNKSLFQWLVSVLELRSLFHLVCSNATIYLLTSNSQEISSWGWRCLLWYYINLWHYGCGRQKFDLKAYQRFRRVHRKIVITLAWSGIVIKGSRYLRRKILFWRVYRVIFRTFTSLGSDSITFRNFASLFVKNLPW